MRRLLLVLLIALLPLRALAGDWMMLGMATGQSVDMPGCDMQLAQAGPQGSSDEASPAGTDAQCSACDLCIPAAASPLSAEAAPVALPQSLRAQGVADFASAALSQDLRPPAA